MTIASDDLKDVPVLLLGLGLNGGGLGVARWLLRQGARVTVSDLKTADVLAPSIEKLDRTAAALGAKVTYVLGEHPEEMLRSHPLIIINPGVRPHAPWLATAVEAGAQIETELTLFFRRCRGKIVGITGTKGKTTTTTLIYQMLLREHPDTVIAGNVRNTSALETLEHITPETPVVLELSSYQLARMEPVRLSPAFACITNISPDHIDWHGTMDAYAEAKAAIYEYQKPGDLLVLNADDAETLRRYQPNQGQTVRWFSLEGRAEADTRLMPDGQVLYDNEPLFSADDLQIPGRHILANALAAATLAKSYGLSPNTIRAVIREFRGVEHRQELIRVLHGVRYVNDTTATLSLAAVTSLNTFELPIVLIAGGYDKGQELESFAKRAAERARAVVLLQGTATPKIEQMLREEQVRLGQQAALQTISGPFDDFEQAIRAAQHEARSGEMVLLAPACPSFGMFQNEYHRGDEFSRIVRTLT